MNTVNPLCNSHNPALSQKSHNRFPETGKRSSVPGILANPFSIPDVKSRKSLNPSGTPTTLNPCNM